MPRMRKVFDAATGAEEIIPYSAEEEAEADAAVKAEREAAQKIAEEPGPAAKLAAFLNANPDVRALLE